MGFFDRLKGMFEDNLNQMTERSKEALNTFTKPNNPVKENEQNNYPGDSQPAYQADSAQEGYYADDEYYYDMDENAVEELSDEDLLELGELVDEKLEYGEGELDEDDIEELHERAEAIGLALDEFDAMLQERMEQMQEAINMGYDPVVVYNTRSVWRRCPSCYCLVREREVYCPVCGHQLRMTPMDVIAGGVMLAGLLSGAAKDNAQKRAASVERKKKAIASGKKQGGRKVAQKRGVPARKTAVSARPTSPSATRPTPPPPPRPNAARPMSPRPGASPAPAPAKKPLFGNRPTPGSTASASKPAAAPAKKSLFGSKPAPTSSKTSASKSSSKSSGGLFGGSSKSSKSSGRKLKLGKRR